MLVGPGRPRIVRAGRGTREGRSPGTYRGATPHSEGRTRPSYEFGIFFGGGGWKTYWRTTGDRAGRAATLAAGIGVRWASQSPGLQAVVRSPPNVPASCPLRNSGLESRGAMGLNATSATPLRRNHMTYTCPLWHISCIHHDHLTNTGAPLGQSPRTGSGGASPDLDTVLLPRLVSPRAPRRSERSGCRQAKTVEDGRGSYGRLAQNPVSVAPRAPGCGWPMACQWPPSVPPWRTHRGLGPPGCGGASTV